MSFCEPFMFFLIFFSLPPLHFLFFFYTRSIYSFSGHFITF